MPGMRAQIWGSWVAMSAASARLSAAAGGGANIGRSQYALTHQIGAKAAPWQGAGRQGSIDVCGASDHGEDSEESGWHGDRGIRRSPSKPRSQSHAVLSRYRVRSVLWIQ